MQHTHLRGMLRVCWYRAQSLYSQIGEVKSLRMQEDVRKLTSRIHKLTSSCVRKLWAGAEAGWGALASGCEGGQRGPCPRPSVGPPTRCIQRAFIASY